jgi:hypothetical protein
MRLDILGAACGQMRLAHVSAKFQLDWKVLLQI